MTELINKIRRGLRKPPRVILNRVYQEISDQAERYLAPKRARNINLVVLLNKTGMQNLNQLWIFLSERPYVTLTKPINSDLLDGLFIGESALILERAQLAIAHKVDLLGSGLVDLGSAINWHKDYKSGYDWPVQYIRDINYNNPERPSDVKFPWEVSRLQWLIPAGQAYLLTNKECYAEAVKDLLMDWIDKNPYSMGINWACTMEVALRIITWTWFFHVFKESKSWEDPAFRQKLLSSLYLHADFTERHLEFSDINGNHYTADAAGLVFAGLFFGKGTSSNRWLEKGWDILCKELPLQVFEDGVDFEASVPYHRLVLELFFLPALYREKMQLKTPKTYSDRLLSMAKFTVAYIQPDGRVPFWGDADDARTLPFGYQSINDHRYLPSIIGYIWHDPLLNAYSGFLSEHIWLLGEQALPYFIKAHNDHESQSMAFPQGGFYVMCNKNDHVFIDCGPLGLGGRGGHGHNDCLSFEAVLNGVKLISDCGAYVYTASYEERNQFRSTAYHNTPCIDNQEINRFIKWDYLWTMHNDAIPIVELWRPGSNYDVFCGSHTGYQRLTDSVTPKRTIILDHERHALVIQDTIVAEGYHEISIPLHLATDVNAEIYAEQRIVKLTAGGKEFTLYWEGISEWVIETASARISPSYGVIESSQKLLWHLKGLGSTTLRVAIIPGEPNPEMKTKLFRLLA
jgi:uncharacterized heparinase superfamily protein